MMWAQILRALLVMACLVHTCSANGHPVKHHHSAAHHKPKKVQHTPKMHHNHKWKNQHAGSKTHHQIKTHGAHESASFKAKLKTQRAAAKQHLLHHSPARHHLRGHHPSQQRSEHSSHHRKSDHLDLASKFKEKMALHQQRLQQLLSKPLVRAIKESL